MAFKFVLLWTDILLYVLLITIALFVRWSFKHEHLRAPWRKVVRRRLGMISFVVLIFFLAIGLLDSIHFRRALAPQASQSITTRINNKDVTPVIHYSTRTESLLDVLLDPLDTAFEKTYSAPFSTHLYTMQTTQSPDGTYQRSYPRLKYAGADLSDPKTQKTSNIIMLASTYAAFGLVLWLAFAFILANMRVAMYQEKFRHACVTLYYGTRDVPWRTILLSLLTMIVLCSVAFGLSRYYHILGTSKIGQDIFYQTLKSIRTGLMIGSLTTLIMLPFAILLGLMAGYFGGWIDDVIQYTYTTLSSIPGVLLIAAAILTLQVYITNHPEYFTTMVQRADMRLLALCIILGVTSWTGLCRLLRGETLKVREMDYIQAAHALGVGPMRILVRHVLPNVAHLILIAIVLDFSGLVLAEAVLSYVGVGVDPTMISWGNMINSARLELAREPVVWWPLFAAFILMFVLVLSANLFSDAVRDGFDPRTEY